MEKETILVVDDEEDILELVRFNLDREGYQVILAASGESCIDVAQQRRPDLIILDLMLPGIDGLEVAKRLKEGPTTADIPILMLTAKGEESDIVIGLELGADDYVTKPFSPRVLVARIRAILRRKGQEQLEESVIRIHGIEIDIGRRTVRFEGRSVELTYTEFGILAYLAGKPGWVFTRTQIVDGVRGDDYHVTDRSVDVQIAGLRKKLGQAGKFVETVRGVGYRFRE